MRRFPATLATFALTAMVSSGAAAQAATCKDAQGHSAKCAPPAAVQCHYPHTGIITKCTSPHAVPVGR